MFLLKLLIAYLFQIDKIKLCNSSVYIFEGLLEIYHFFKWSKRFENQENTNFCYFEMVHKLFYEFVKLETVVIYVLILCMNLK